MNKDEVLTVAGGPVGKIGPYGGAVLSIALEEETALYTEAQLLAIYAKGAADMKERLISSIKGRPYRPSSGPQDYDDGWNDCVDEIRALPISDSPNTFTQTNTEGENNGA